MKKTTTITALTAVLLLTGCACVNTEYKAFEGTREGIMDGKGGTKTVVNGMEIWDSGEPPHKFKILGFIDDNRGAGWSHWSSVHEDIVEKARSAGGDAVIKMNTQSQLAEFYKAGGAVVNIYGSYASSAYLPSNRKITKYAVIKYFR